MWLPFEVAARPRMTELLKARQLMALAWLVFAGGQSVAWGVPGVVVPAGAHPALVHVERGTIEMRTDPEASKRDADEALRLLEQQPDADLEVQARLLLEAVAAKDHRSLHVVELAAQVRSGQEHGRVNEGQPHADPMQAGCNFDCFAEFRPCRKWVVEVAAGAGRMCSFRQFVIFPE